MTSGKIGREQHKPRQHSWTEFKLLTEINRVYFGDQEETSPPEAPTCLFVTGQKIHAGSLTIKPLDSEVEEVASDFSSDLMKNYVVIWMGKQRKLFYESVQHF